MAVTGGVMHALRPSWGLTTNIMIVSLGYDCLAYSKAYAPEHKAGKIQLANQRGKGWKPNAAMMPNTPFHCGEVASTTYWTLTAEA